MNEDTPTHIGSVEDEASGYVGPYKLLQRLGEGGMGTVYMAEQQVPVRRRVALKVIKPGMDSRQVIARFEAERQALAMMEHQNIARVLDAGTTEDQRPYFVMELVQGIPITDYCDRNRLTLQERLALFIPVCHAIQHAHQKGIIHRDIKPSNILLTMYDGKPVPKVIDFGLAKALQQPLTERTMFTQFGQVVGTLEYMSPEQAEMNALDVDTRSDIYSLGVLMYELLTSTTPLKKQTLKEQAFDRVLQIIREEDPPKPSTRLSESGDAITGISSQRRLEPRRLSQLLRGDLDWIVMTALDKDRARRYQTATDFAADVRRFLDNQPIEARPPSTAYRLQKLLRRHASAVFATAAFVLLLLAGIVTSSLLALNAYDARQLAEKRLGSEQAARTEAERLRARDNRLREIAEAERDKARAAEKRATEQAQIARGEANAATFVAETLKTSLEPVPKANTTEEIFSANGLMQVADRLFENKEAGRIAQTAARLTPSAGFTTGLSIASAARAVARLRRTEETLESAIQSQRDVLASENNLTNRTSLSASLALAAKLYIQDKRYDEAAKAAAESIELRSRDQAEDWRIFETKSVLGEALSFQKAYDLAEAELLAGFRGLQQYQAQIPAVLRNRTLTTAAERLVSHYTAHADAVKLVNWQSELEKLKDKLQE